MCVCVCCKTCNCTENLTHTHTHTDTALSLSLALSVCLSPLYTHTHTHTHTHPTNVLKINQTVAPELLTQTWFLFLAVWPRVRLARSTPPLHTPEKQEKLECQKADPATDTDSDTDTVPSARQAEPIEPLFLAARRVPQVCCSPQPQDRQSTWKKARRRRVLVPVKKLPLSPSVARAGVTRFCWRSQCVLHVTCHAAPRGLLRGQEV